MSSEQPSEQTFQCSQCPKVFKHKPSLIRHLKQVHLNNHKKLTCENCDGQFRDKCDLSRHQLVCRGGGSSKRKADGEPEDSSQVKIPKLSGQDLIDFEVCKQFLSCIFRSRILMYIYV